MGYSSEVTVEDGHGRVEYRSYYLSTALSAAACQM